MSGSSSCSFRVKAAIANELVDKPMAQASSSCSVVPELAEVSEARRVEPRRASVLSPLVLG